MKKQQLDIQMVIYQTPSGALELKADVQHETIWLTQQQVAELFDVQKAAISKHVRNIFDSKELEHKATVSKMETVQKEGARNVKRTIEYYNLDLVLSIGYRVNSKQATHFRRWATKILKHHIIQGYTINRHRIHTNYTEFLKAVDDVKALLPAGSVVENDSILELVKLFADTWFSLDAYDKDALVTTGITKKKIKLTAENLTIALVLYFIIKNHPFVDGNKRSGAYAFVWFLRQAKILDTSRITPPALTAITLLIAESNPKDKEKMIGLVCMLLAKQ